MSDDEDWDKDFEIQAPVVPKLALPSRDNNDLPSTQRTPPPNIADLLHKDEDDEDWTKDFEDDSEEAKPLKIIGMKAEPTNTENWDEFFVLPTNNEKGITALSERKTFTLNRIGSLISNIDRLDFFLKDVLQLFSDSKKAKDHEPEESWDDEIEQESKDKKPANTKVEESKAVFELGMSDLGQENSLDAIKHFQAAHALLHGVPIDERDTNFEIELHYQTGLASRNTSQTMLEATNHFKQAADALSSLRKLTDAQKLIKFRTNKELGICYDVTSNFSLASQCYGESIKAVMSLPSPETHSGEIAKICLQLGKCCQQLSGAVVDLSRDFLKKALEFAEKAADNETKTAAHEALTKLKSSNASGEEDRSTSSGTAELDDLDSEDWDKEFGVDTDRQKLSLETMGSAMQKTASITEQSPQGGAELPKRLKFLENLKNDVEIVKFPKATFFYSGIKTKDGHRFLNEDALESWLQTLASKHASDLFSVKVTQMNYKNELEIKQQFVSRLQNSTKYSLDWAKIQYEYVLTLFSLKKTELLWDTLFNVFVDLKDTSIAKLKQHDQDVFMNLIMQMVYIASKMWTHENDHSFKDVLKSVTALQPKARDLISLVEVETIIHHTYHQLDDKGFIAQLKKLASVYNSVNSRSPGPHPTVTDYSKQSFSELDDLSVKVRALCNLHFIMNNLSPLTTHQQNVSSYDENDPDNPDSARKNSTNSGSVESMNFNGSELLDPSVRMTILTGLYNSLPVCYLKAKAAFALAHHNYFEMESWAIAEQLLFESLYIMDILDSPVAGIFPVISELGTNALLRYAEVLLKNYKYVYAAASYESAIVNYKLRKRTGYDALLKKIATVTKENDDNKRAIEYFREVLEMYYKEGKSNEIRYVSEMISSLYFEIGDFRKAEAFLSNALSTVPQPVAPTDVPKIDPITFKLQMKLSDIYLDSYHYEKGIEVLQFMIRAVLPHGSRPQVLEKLAKAYIKKRWFVEATTILDHLKIDLAGSQFSPASSTGSILGSSVDYSSSPSEGFVSTSSLNNNNNTSNLNTKLIKYWELSSVNYYNAGLFPQAIYCIDMAISSCPTTSLASLARYFRIRGKIFQLLSSPAYTVQFPTTLQPTEKELFPPKPNHPHRVYTCVGDFIQECVSNYNKAYTYFKAIGDDIRIAKTTASIAQTYLEHLFFPVAVTGLPYNELARLPSFEVSEIAKASSLKEKRGKGGSSGRTKGVLPHVKSVDKDFFISLEKIENPARCALDIAADTFNPILLAKSYLNMAELRYLQNDTEIAVAFWSECKELLFQLYITTDNVAIGPNNSHHYCGLLGKGAPPQAISKVYKLFKRLVRFLFCMDAEFINKNTVVIDVFMGLEYDLDHSQKRPTPSLVHVAADQQHAKVMESDQHSTSDSELKSDKPSSLGKSSSKHKPSTLPSLNSSILNTLNLTPQPSSVGASSSNFMVGAMGLKSAPTQGARKSVASIFANELEFEDMEKFSSKENLIAKTLEINEESAERIWGFLYLIQVQTTTYTKGKVTAEELLSRIKKTTRKILQVKRFNDAIKQTLLEITTSPVNSPNPKANLRRIPSMSAISFPKDQTTGELMKTTKALSKLIFAIQIDDHIVYYVPSNGEKRIQKIGGKDDYNTNQMNTFWYLTIHLMKYPEEYVMLVVNPNLSLDKLLKHLCNKAYWEHEDNKKKSFFGSFGKTTTPQVHKLKYVDRSKGFHGGFLDLLTSLESEAEPEKQGGSEFKGKMWTSAELSRISFAKKVVSQDSTVSFVPLTVSTHTTVSQCFTIPETQEASAENPLALYMYLSSQTRNLTTLDIQRENVNRTLYITKEMVNYFTSLVASHSLYEPDQGKKVINDLVDNIVACVEDILPYSNDKANPLILVCSKVLHIFPWELMFRESLTRHLTMQDVVVFLKKRAPKPNAQDEEAMVPKYYGCYYSGGDKHLMPVEEKRKDWILKEYFQRLKLRSKAPSNLHGLGYLPPLHCALVKYGKKISAYKRTYRYMTWFDMAPVFTPDDLVRTVDSLTLAHYSIFVLSYADLLEANESVMYLMRTHPTCTFLFIPSTKMKVAVSKLMKVQEEAFSTKGKIKTTQTPAQFLSATISALQTENSSPIAIINPVL